MHPDLDSPGSSALLDPAVAPGAPVLCPWPTAPYAEYGLLFLRERALVGGVYSHPFDRWPRAAALQSQLELVDQLHRAREALFQETTGSGKLGPVGRMALP